MIRLLLAVTCIIIASAIFFAVKKFEGISGKHEMMSHSGAGEDSRIELKIPGRMKVVHKAVMRSHLDSLGSIVEAIASGELKKAATVARKDLGLTPDEEKMCDTFGGGNMEYLAMGKAMHANADRLADDASKGLKTAALYDIAGLIKSCNACHEKFRH